MDNENEYRERMRRKKAVIDRRIEAASKDKGILIALIGEGLGKSSSAYGMAARAVGHGLGCAIACLRGPGGGELDWLAGRPGVTVHRAGEASGADTAEWVSRALSDDQIGLVVLDELDTALAQGRLGIDPLLDWIAARPTHQHLALTGQTLPEALLDGADTITELRDAKGVLAAIEQPAASTATDSRSHTGNGQ